MHQLLDDKLIPNRMRLVDDGAHGGVRLELEHACWNTVLSICSIVSVILGGHHVRVRMHHKRMVFLQVVDIAA